MNKSAFIVLFGIVFTLPLFSAEKIGIITVENLLPFERNSETVVIFSGQLILPQGKTLSDCRIAKSETGEILRSQIIDRDMDDIPDAILFQPAIPANSKKEFDMLITDKNYTGNAISRAYSRFVPERIDDYAWENDLVAFRTYGPEAQRLTEVNDPGGTLSSGLDCWLKRVDYPIIDKWYEKYSSKTGTYHKDTGEGLDNYHVGLSRGCGGIGIWDEQNELLYVSKNFNEWKTLENGPIRTCFDLKYAPWTAGSDTIFEIKHILLDLGCQLSKVIVEFDNGSVPDTVTVGLTLHNKVGNISADKNHGWFSYWEPLDDSELGTAIVADSKHFAGYKVYKTDKPDMSHLFVQLLPIDGKIEYFFGFGWKKGGQIENEQAWNNYLTEFILKLNSPLEIQIK